MVKVKRKLALFLMCCFVFVLWGAFSFSLDEAEASSHGTVIKWQVATGWPESMFLHAIPKKWAEDINKASGGRLVIELYPAGALVAAQELLDAANMGIINAYHAATNLWVGKMTAAPFFCSFPMIFSEPGMQLGWLYEGGGLELWQKMYDQAGYNVKIFPLGFTGPETLAWSNVKIEKIDDWKGLKYRGAGWWAELLRNIGVSVTTLPPGELYQALERGVLDALEFSTPNDDKNLGYYEIAKYNAGPGMHQPHTVYYLGINKASWESLPDDMKALVELAARATTMWSYTHDLEKSMQANEYFQSKGVIPVKVDEASQQRLYEDINALLDKKAQEQGGLFAETWTSIKEYRERFLKFEDFMKPISGK
jgi:TRAP-type mannitol/chloroaromatic compound transport system substrate-binding protein